MTIPQVALLLFALAVLAATFVVVGRLLRCVVRAVRSAQPRRAAGPAAAILGLLALLAAVVAVWFGYGLAHGPKDASTDLTVMLVTGVPFFGACWALWRLARRVETRIGNE